MFYQQEELHHFVLSCDVQVTSSKMLCNRGQEMSLLIRTMQKKTVKSGPTCVCVCVFKSHYHDAALRALLYINRRHQDTDQMSVYYLIIRWFVCKLSPILHFCIQIVKYYSNHQIFKVQCQYMNYYTPHTSKRIYIRQSYCDMSVLIIWLI